MPSQYQQLHDVLKSHNYSLTKPRKIIFSSLQDCGPQTLQEIAKTCQDSVDRASVYRTIGLFENLGIITRIQIGWKYKVELSGDFSYHHHHLNCEVCGQTIAVDEDEVIELRLQSIASQNNFIIKAHQLEIHGICSRCQPS